LHREGAEKRAVIKSASERAPLARVVMGSLTGIWERWERYDWIRAWPEHIASSTVLLRLHAETLSNLEHDLMLGSLPVREPATALPQYRPGSNKPSSGLVLPR
jgi:hypothetical protein